MKKTHRDSILEFCSRVRGETGSLFLTFTEWMETDGEQRSEVKVKAANELQQRNKLPSYLPVHLHTSGFVGFSSFFSFLLFKQ